MADETININHEAAKRNSEELHAIAEKVADIRKQIAQLAHDGIGPVFLTAPGKGREWKVAQNVANKLSAELSALDKGAERIEEVASSMKAISDSFENLDTYGMITSSTQGLSDFDWQH